MQLSNIQQFLETYRKQINKEDHKRNTIINIFYEETGVKIDEKALVIKKGIVSIKTNAIIKNEIFLRKAKIIARLQADKTLEVYDVI